MRALLIEDDASMAQSIALMLKQENIETEHVELGETGLEQARAVRYDLILLDLTLPDMTGYDVLQALRHGAHQTPVLILSGLSAIQDKVRGLALGADDYLTKPFHKDELVARLRAIHRRSQDLSRQVIAVGTLEVHLDNQEITIGGARVHLTNKEYHIVELMAQRLGSTLTKEMLLNHLYGGMDEPEMKIIDVFICKVRRKLADASGGLNFIETVWGRGYMLREPTVDLAAVS